MTKKELNKILKQILEIKKQLAIMDQSLIDENKLFSLQDYRSKLKELNELKILRDSYKSNKKEIKK